MTRRKCPECGAEWYSAQSRGSWTCEKCAATIREEDELPVERGLKK